MPRTRFGIRLDARHSDTRIWRPDDHPCFAPGSDPLLERMGGGKQNPTRGVWQKFQPIEASRETRAEQPRLVFELHPIPGGIRPATKAVEHHEMRRIQQRRRVRSENADDVPSAGQRCRHRTQDPVMLSSAAQPQPLLADELLDCFSQCCAADIEIPAQFHFTRKFALPSPGNQALAEKLHHLIGDRSTDDGSLHDV